MFNAIDFGTRLRQIRLRRSITIKSISKKTGMSTNQVHRIEHGENVTIYSLETYLQEIGLTLDKLV